MVTGKAIILQERKQNYCDELFYTAETMISLQQKFTLSKEVLSQEVDEESVLLDMKSESYFGLDEVGTRIWQLLKNGSDLQNVFEILLAEYEVGEDELKKDLQEHIAQLVDAGLISLTELNPDDPKG